MGRYWRTLRSFWSTALAVWLRSKMKSRWAIAPCNVEAREAKNTEYGLHN